MDMALAEGRGAALAFAPAVAALVGGLTPAAQSESVPPTATLDDFPEADFECMGLPVTEKKFIANDVLEPRAMRQHPTNTKSIFAARHKNK